NSSDFFPLLSPSQENREGWEILGTVGHGKIPEDIPVATCSDFRWTEPTILLLGNEGYGLCPETRMLCHRMLTITPGRDLEFGVESLNVSVAAGKRVCLLSMMWSGGGFCFS
uniref:tRNA/rRNA methyltransferase SpoU type domain-containing protein n=1 Tax=Naja naja TaxID=35670 RepID=A0A8C7E3C3_NAJNA